MSLGRHGTRALVLPFVAMGVAMGVVATSLVLAGCAADDDEASTDADEQVVSAFYDVPTTGADELPFASNPVEARVRTLDGGKRQVRYLLPEVIAGRHRVVDMTSTPDGDGGATLSGPSGTGSCDLTATPEIVCHVHLTGVAMSLDEATEAINAVAKTESERLARLSIAQKFIGDPLGVVRFARSPSSD